MSESSAVSQVVPLTILSATMVASGATPVGPAATAATEVPCPSQSIGSASSSPKSCPAITFALGNAPPPSSDTV